MSDERKHPRHYRSPLRERRARETRERVMEVARALFIERGYEATTVRAIAERAQVSAETIYAVFGNKRSLLERLVRVAVTGEEGERPLMEGPGPAAVHAAPDQRELLRRFAHDITWRVEHVGPLMEVVAAAALGEPEMTNLHKRLQAGRLENLQAMVEWLAELGSLRMPVDRAADVVWALASPEIFGLLTRGRGWSSQEFEQWLRDSLVELLVPTD
jgi:AcrR family transcriptional regulator